ncbi:MAG: [Fe-Fe] hydrogenase large subunit C-terminal domain-containing protein, partial [Oscillospiraceae bacterium]
VGTNVEGKMVTALRRLGFDKVFDVDNAADFTIMEEGTEFLDRMKNKGELPLITSCSPGWVRYCEQHYPKMLPNLSSCKSPQQMFGSLVKSYYAETAGIDPKDIFVVSVMPCTAKKYEVLREDQRMQNGCLPVDVSLTTRELGRMIAHAGLLFDHLPEASFDELFGISTGASVIFGTSGGVMEAALRTVVELVTKGEMKPLEFQEVRGLSGIKEASYDLQGKIVKVCVASGLANAKTVLDSVASGEAHYDFIELMACPGGCINGGGQPLQPAEVRNFTDLVALRSAALYQQDAGMTLRKSHENPYVTKVYEEYLGAPGSHKAHEILHCTYKAQKRYHTD